MTLNGETGQFALSAERSNTLQGAVRRALNPARPWLASRVIAAGIAGAIPLAATGAPFPAVFPLASLAEGDGSEGFVLNGIDRLDESGEVSNAGDVNGDGIDDLIIGADRANPGGDHMAGESYVVFGRTQAFPAEFELSDLPSGDGSAGFLLSGTSSPDLAGSSVSAAGDVNGDGIDDVIVGAPGTTARGKSYVVFGRDTTQAGNFPAVFRLVSLLRGDGSEGFVLAGLNDDGSGSSVSAAGDVNGDGIDDLIIGAPDADLGGQDHAGQSYVVFGRDTAQAGNFPAMFPIADLLPDRGGDGSAGFVLLGINFFDRAGISVNAAGDVNGDGIDDVIVGAPSYYGKGRSYVVFGRNTAQAGDFPAVIHLATLLPGLGGDGSAGFVIEGIEAFDWSGYSVSAAGDVNGDGIDDLMVGAPDADPGGRTDAGESYVVFGRDTAQLGNFPAVFPLVTLRTGAGGDGSKGFVLSGINVGDLAYFTGAAGDMDGDGIDDLLIGARAASSADGPERAGETYVVFGRETAQTGNFPAVFQLADLQPERGGDGSSGFVLQGVDERDFSGTSVSAAGDVNGDGMDDLIIGARLAGPGGRDQAGESYVVFGRSSAQ